MIKKPNLMDRLDKAAEMLLDRTFQTTGEAAPLEDQVRVFDSIVKYYGPRIKLGGSEKQESQFERLQSRLNGRKAARRTAEAGTETDGSTSPEPAGTA
jgi:hypothetical protein